MKPGTLQNTGQVLDARVGRPQTLAVILKDQVARQDEFWTRPIDTSHRLSVLHPARAREALLEMIPVTGPAHPWSDDFACRWVDDVAVLVLQTPLLLAGARA